MKKLALFHLLLQLFVICYSDRPAHIVIDGNFDDWKVVRIYPDPMDNIQKPPLQDGVFDCHGTEDTEKCAQPPHVFNPTSDMLEYALAHDEHHLYAYFKAFGNISKSAVGSTGGRVYIQVCLDLDNNEETGFCTNSGGYYPASCGYDMNFEVEIYNGTFNTAHILLHSMQTQADYDKAIEEQKRNVVSFAPANYKPYTEWVYWDDRHPITDEEKERCPNGPFYLPGDNHPVICFVQDKCNCRFKGTMDYAFSEDYRQFEFSVPFNAFMNLPDGTPAVALERSITAYLSLETSGEFSDPIGSWMSDGSWPIRDYYLEGPRNIN